MTFELSESLRCLAVMGNFSRLLIDPSKPLTDLNLIRTTYKAPENDIPVSFNSQGYRLFERLETFYLEYHKLLRESLDYLEPSCILNVHSHDPELSPNVPHDIVLYHPQAKSSKLIEALHANLSKDAKVQVLDRLSSHDPELCSPMVFENLIFNQEG